MGETIAWGEWKPDVSAYRGQHSPTITNVVPRGDGYGPVRAFSAMSGALPDDCRGFFCAYDDDGTINIFAGTATRLYKMSNTSFAFLDVSKSDASELSYSGSTNIGNATGGGGLAAAFDGTTAQAAAACAALAASTSAFVGKTLASAVPIHSVKIYGSNNAGYVSTINPTMVCNLYGKNGTAPASGTDGTLIGTLTFTDTADESVARTITATDPNNTYLHVWVDFTHNGAANTINIAELEFFSADDYALPSGKQWQFAQFNNRVIAVQPGDAPQSFVLGSSLNFANLAGSPPTASYVTIINQFVFLSGLVSDPFTIQWSSRSDPTEWTAGTNEGDTQTFSEGGIVRGVAGGEFGIVFQDRSIRRLTYQPGSAIIFDIDVISEDLGLFAPYSLCQSRDMVFFLSQVGFQMWHPMTGFKFIGKERVDRTFAEDADTVQLYLILGTPDPASTRILWAYKSTSQALTDRFDRIIIYDWALDRWAGFINIEGEYIGQAATPGITLESLDSISSSLDALGVSLDSFTSGTEAAFMIFNTSHMLGTMTGATLEATLETADIEGGQRGYLRAQRPITDAATVYCSAGGRQRQMDAISYSVEANVGAVGFAPHRFDNRLVRLKNRIPAGTEWTFSVGTEPEMVLTGLR